MRVGRGDFDALVMGATTSAFRLETRERYDEPGEVGPLARFLAGQPDDLRWHQPWLEFLGRSPARFQRVRVVSRPPSDYTRFGLVLAASSIAAGEDIRYLDRADPAAAGLPDHDFWLVDGQTVAALLFDPDDVLTGAEITTDPAVVDQHLYWQRVAWRAAVPPDQFTR